MEEINIDDDNICFAIIYEECSSNNADEGDYHLKFKTVALVEKKSKDKYRIVSGQLEGKTEQDYDLLLGQEDYIHENYTVLHYIKGSKDKKKNKIFIFSIDYINNIIEKENISKLQAICKIASEAQNVKLCHNFNMLGEVHFKALIKKEKKPITSAQILRMLFSKNDELYRKILISTTQDTYSLSTEVSQNFLTTSNILLRNSLNVRLKNMDIIDIIDRISRKIIGQEDAIRSVVSNVYFNQILIDSISNLPLKECANELDSRKVAILLDGTTGTGKTAIAKEIAAILDIPISIVNANSFSETGFVGPSITDILQELLKQTKNDVERAQRGIIVLDEIDKLAETDLESRSMKLGVQKELLGFMSGAKYEIKESVGPFGSPAISFDTSKLTFILCGAFTTIKEQKIASNDKKLLGFSTLEQPHDRSYTMDSQDYVDFGLMREFFGRIKVITSTKTYNIEDFKRILIESELSPLKGLEKTCIMFGYPGITYNEEFLDKICKYAYEMQTGARALQNLISGIQDILLIDLISKNYDINEPIELTIDLLEKYNKRKIRSY